MFFNLRTKIISPQSQIVFYGGNSFWLQVWVYRFLMHHKQKTVLIHQSAKEKLRGPNWKFLTADPRLQLVDNQQIEKIKNLPAVDYFIDASFLSVYEDMEAGFHLKVEAGFGLLNRLSLAYHHKAEYVLLVPLVRDITSETALFYQMKHHQHFLDEYSRNYGVGYKIIQLADYLSPNFITNPSRSFWSQTLMMIKQSNQLPFNPRTEVYLNDVIDQIQQVENFVFGAGRGSQVSLKPAPTSLSQLGNKITSKLGRPMIYVDHHAPKPKPLFITTQTLSTNTTIGSNDIDKLIPLMTSPNGPAPFVSKPDQPQIVSAVNLRTPSPPLTNPKIKPRPTKNQDLVSRSGNRSRLIPSFNLRLPRLSPTHLQRLSLVLFLTLLFISLPFVILFYHIAAGLRYLDKSLDEPAAVAEIRNQSRLAVNSLQRAEAVITGLAPVFRLVGMETSHGRLDDIVTFFRLIAQTNYNRTLILPSAERLISYVFDKPGADLSFNRPYKQLSGQTYESFTNLNEALALYQDKVKQYESVSLLSIGPKINQAYQKLKTQQAQLARLRQVLSVLPQFLGMDQRRQYLMIVLDNNEIRPGGGLVTAYAVLTFEGGQLLDWQVYDAYNLDNQLKGRIPPPKPIETYLGQVNWYLRDSAWEINFVDSARQMIWFYNKALGQEVDGVIAVDLGFFVQMAKVWSGFYLSDLNLKLTDKNLYEQAYLWGDLTAGNQNSLSVSLLKAFWLNMKNLNQNNLSIMASSWVKAADQKQVRLYFNHTLLQQAGNQLNWAGRVNLPYCDADCLVAGGIPVQANLGANRVNANLRYQVSVNVSLTPDYIYQKLNLFIKNTSTSPKWPGGDYKDYLQWYVDRGWQLEEVRVVDQAIPDDQIDKLSYGSLIAYGVFHQVPFGQNQTITFSFKRPRLKTDKSNDVLFWLIKPPGLRNAKASLEIDSSEPIKLISPQTWQRIKNKAVYTDSFQKDIIVPVRIKSKKN